MNDDETKLSLTYVKRFMAAFNQLERYFRDILDAPDHWGFTELVRRARQKKWLTESMAEELTIFAKLRNAIVHGQYFDGEPIAEPHAAVVEQIERYAEAMNFDRTALALLPRQDTVNLSPETTVKELLTKIHTTGYTRFPIYQGRQFLWLLSANAMTKFLAVHHDDHRYEHLTVADIKQFCSNSDRAELVPRTITGPEVKERFTSIDETGHAPTALIVTETGASNQRPLRIIVPSDVPIIMQKIQAEELKLYL
ncbi:hypothetical protein ACFPVT_06295 [Corynebacterium choanae]|uniref:hypothetical protein n=1 Tax=Corynebacterium choanae TaxID=1862358 RepID=UPI000F506824|nr:hypothetical protein [Corynebacterium choanae]